MEGDEGELAGPRLAVRSLEAPVIAFPGEENIADAALDLVSTDFPVLDEPREATLAVLLCVLPKPEPGTPLDVPAYAGVGSVVLDTGI